MDIDITSFTNRQFELKHNRYLGHAIDLSPNPETPDKPIISKSFKTARWLAQLL